MICKFRFEICDIFQLQGEIDDCSCEIESVDSFNNIKVIPLLDDLLQRDYFRYYKVCVCVRRHCSQCT